MRHFGGAFLPAASHLYETLFNKVKQVPSGCDRSCSVLVRASPKVLFVIVFFPVGYQYSGPVLNAVCPILPLTLPSPRSHVVAHLGGGVESPGWFTEWK